MLSLAACVAAVAVGVSLWWVASDNSRGFAGVWSRAVVRDGTSWPASPSDAPVADLAVTELEDVTRLRLPCRLRGGPTDAWPLHHKWSFEHFQACRGCLFKLRGSTVIARTSMHEASNLIFVMAAWLLAACCLATQLP
jgi:hypothetical protein